MNKKSIKITLIVLGVILFIALAFSVYYSVITYGVNLDKNKLVDMNSSIEFLDCEGNVIEEWSDDKFVTDAGDIPDYTLNAFVAIEDKRFYSHHGIDVKGLLRAAINNLKSFSFKEGASTISQQLIKNTHLSGEKTLKRKVLEIKLARQLEKNYTKKEILEMYVNTIYFGDGCYGITKAANNYFGVSPQELTLNQSAALAGIVKAPAVYSPKISPEKCTERKNLVLKEMHKQNFITDEEYEKNKNADVVTIETEQETTSPYLKLVKKELNTVLDNSVYAGSKIKVYTYYNKNLQKDVEDAVKNSSINSDKKAIILNDKNKIQAFFSTCGDIPRQLGSTIKPIGIFAPAIDTDNIDACTPVMDEKININGYSPSNYKDVYYGYVSARFALAKSLNSCAVKILNECGTEDCINYLKRTDIPVSENDNALRLALGVTENGATLTQLAGAYGAFINKGLYISPTSIAKISLENGTVLYTDNENPIRLYGEDTAFIINDMLKYTVKEGTAKTLDALKIPLAAKTGTVGNEKGNTDAYSISYNGDYTISIWVGNADSSLMTNSVSGGTVPTKIAFSAWQNMINRGYNANDTFTTDDVVSVSLDKISYEHNHIVEMADDNFPPRYVITEYFKKSRIPKTISDRFSSPKIESAEISVKNNKVYIRLCLAEYYNFKIYRESDGLKIQLYDSKGKNKKEFVDKYLMPDKSYIYSVIPYASGKNGIKFGKEYFLNEIKTSPIKTIDDDWWKDFYPDFVFN